jgi:2-polyprenyl-3-methyl-5-hydroxy-6-metoxy-1,4-benzoquinol methylase
VRPVAASVTRKNTLEAYDSVYDSDRMLDEYLRPERLEFYDELATIVAPLAPHSVLDVGCGTGHLLRFLVDRMQTSPERIVGVDHSEAGIRRARALLPEGTWHVEDLFSLSLDGDQFDLVLCSEVLEHLDEPGRAVDVLLRLCAPGGRVAITVPDGAQDSWEGHVNFWDEHDLRAFLAPHGLVAIHRIDNGGVFLAWLAPGDG